MCIYCILHWCLIWCVNVVIFALDLTLVMLQKPTMQTIIISPRALLVPAGSPEHEGCNWRCLKNKSRLYPRDQRSQQILATVFARDNFTPTDGAPKTAMWFATHWWLPCSLPTCLAADFATALISASTLAPYICHTPCVDHRSIWNHTF